MMRLGLSKLGYKSWEQLWAAYIVFAVVRNPYDRAGSSFDYLKMRRPVRQPGLHGQELYVFLCFYLGICSGKVHCGSNPGVHGRVFHTRCARHTERWTASPRPPSSLATTK
jgi:hypothetical protein